MLPARLDALASPPFSTDMIWKLVIVGLTTGRTFPATRMWGLIEDRLAEETSAVWAEVLANPNLDLDAVIARRMGPLAERLDLALNQG